MRNCFGKNRKAIMGIAILLVVLLHSDLALPSILHFARRLGYIQVDTFMMLSGYGLYCSLEKGGTISSFLKKRFIRVYPTYFLLALAFLVYKSFSISIPLFEIVGVITGLSYWAGRSLAFSWFGQSIMLFYFAAPVLYEVIKGKSISVKKCLIVLACSYLVVIPFITDGRLMLPIARIPSFVMGMLLADYHRRHGEVSKKGLSSLIVMMIVSFAGLAFCRVYLVSALERIFQRTYLLIYLWSPFIVPGLLILFSKLTDFFYKSWIGSKVIGCIEHIGDATFEIYLVQSLLYMILREQAASRIPTVTLGVNLFWIFMGTISILMGMGLQRYLIQPVQKKLLKKVNRNENCNPHNTACQ